MPAWDDLLHDFSALTIQQRAEWVHKRHVEALLEVSKLCNNRHVMVYGSAFLQKPQVPAALLSITHEDINGLMGVIYGMDPNRGLTLLLHTPGGQTNAAESIVAYLRSKFASFEVIVPTLAMSAGTMISLAADRIVMGRQSQLGPIDPQMPVGGRQVSARAVVEQFERARLEVTNDPRTAHVWAPIVQSLGPALLQEAQNALDYSEQMVAGWLRDYMFKKHNDPEGDGKKVAHHFNDATTHKSHGRRIDRQEALDQGVDVAELEKDQALQEAVLTAYHVMTIAFEQGPAAKILLSETGRSWVKNYVSPEQQALAQKTGQPLTVQPSRAGQPPGGAAPNRAERRRQTRGSNR